MIDWHARRAKQNHTPKLWHCIDGRSSACKVSGQDVFVCKMWLAHYHLLRNHTASRVSCCTTTPLMWVPHSTWWHWHQVLHARLRWNSGPSTLVQQCTDAWTHPTLSRTNECQLLHTHVGCTLTTGGRSSMHSGWLFNDFSACGIFKRLCKWRAHNQKEPNADARMISMMVVSSTQAQLFTVKQIRQGVANAAHRVVTRLIYRAVPRIYQIHKSLSLRHCCWLPTKCLLKVVDLHSFSFPRHRCLLASRPTVQLSQSWLQNNATRC